MSENNGPGFIDPNYGENGLAAIPAPGLDPAVYTLQVFPAACAPDGSMAFYGYAPGPTPKYGWFTRLNADGQWDSATGHVPVSTEQAKPLPEYVYNFASMIHAVVDGAECYLTASRVLYVDDPDVAYLHVAIGRYDAEDFKPSVDFGDDGIALPKPSWQTSGHSRPIESQKLRAKIPHSKQELNAVDYRDTPKLGVIDDTIRVIFGGAYDNADTTKENTWCALLDAKTGEPVSGLGPEGKESQYRLTLIDDESTTLYHAEFLSDGGGLLLSSTDRKMYLHRFLPNALPDKTFANGQGYIVLPSGGHKAGMAVNDHKIVVSRSGNLGEAATELYCYTLAGEEETTFRRSLSVPGHTLILDHLSFDSQDRLVLAGQRNSAAAESGMQVVRLLTNGELDADFGQGGYSPVNEYQAASNGLYLNDQGVRVLTLMPVGFGPFYEQMVKFYS